MGTVTIPLVFGPFLDGFLAGVLVTIFFLLLVPLIIVCSYRKCCKRSSDQYASLDRHAGSAVANIIYYLVFLSLHFLLYYYQYIDCINQGNRDSEGLDMKVFSKASKHSELSLVKDFIMDTDQFQHSWNQWLVSGEYRMYVIGEDHIEELLLAHRITCLASGNPEGYSKYYLYAQDIARHVYLVEMTIKDKQLSAVFKSDAPASTPKFVSIFADATRRLSPL